MTVIDLAYRKLARPVLFRLGKGDPESAHRSTLTALSRASGLKPLVRAASALLVRDRVPRRVFGVDFPSPVGLAAGLDKDATAVKAWPALGFGYVELGTVTAQPQPGNDRPRLFRLTQSEALVNRMGFNNAGAEKLAETLRAAGPIGVPIGISVGKSKATPIDSAVEDYLCALRVVYAHADYIAVNVSSPNTPDLRSLQDRRRLTELLGALTAEAKALQGNRSAPVPILVKIDPDRAVDAIADVLEVCENTEVSGVIATNTTVSREWVAAADRRKAAEAGGLSGAPLRSRALGVVRFVAAHTDLPVIGVGGISRPEHGIAMLDAGADLLQIYTGFIYAGPGLLTGLNRALARRAQEDGGQP